MRLTLTEEQQKEIVRLLNLGISCAEIARRLKVHPNTVWRFKKKTVGVNEKTSIPEPALIQDEYDLQKWQWLQKNWHFKKPEPPKPKPRKIGFHTPYNYEIFRKEEPNDT